MRLSGKYAALIVMIAIFAVWAAAYPLAQLLPRDTFSDPFEPVYNGLNVLFTALAFGGVIVTLFFQADEARIARREAVERSIFEMFQTFTSPDFQDVKDRAYLVLLTAVKDRAYGEFLASRLFVVEQQRLPESSMVLVRSLAPEKQDLDDKALVHADRNDRLRLDNMINFFNMLAQRESSGTVVKHFDFAYDWWRPVLWIIAQFQLQQYEASPTIRQYCRNPLLSSTLRTLDAVYGHAPLNTSAEVWAYINTHPKLKDFELDPNYQTLPETQPAHP
ncbi:hypothetical protein [Pseudomonas sp. GD03944]|uniref:hypothetical protein n=1 Tax=Pseudomonas sp. GD03944 TaxID=2975409 RepID=UPI0024499522|nr:hypothetical protein [Pseudomonas sp. GD03944]MDH1264973.1 hypothetical protein [Pseudomonas sp. GD03944]